MTAIPNDAVKIFVCVSCHASGNNATYQRPCSGSCSQKLGLHSSSTIEYQSKITKSVSVAKNLNCDICKIIKNQIGNWKQQILPIAKYQPNSISVHHYLKVHVRVSSGQMTLPSQPTRSVCASYIPGWHSPGCAWLGSPTGGLCRKPQWSPPCAGQPGSELRWQRKKNCVHIKCSKRKVRVLPWKA